MRGVCWFRQRAGQMALDMRPRSTCRRLTKAIPAPFMAEACHGPIGGVHYCPRYGRSRPGLWDDVTGVTCWGAVCVCWCGPFAVCGPVAAPQTPAWLGVCVGRGRWGGGCGRRGAVPLRGLSSARRARARHGCERWWRLVLRGAPTVSPPHAPPHTPGPPRPREGGGRGIPSGPAPPREVGRGIPPGAIPPGGPLGGPGRSRSGGCEQPGRGRHRGLLCGPGERSSAGAGVPGGRMRRGGCCSGGWGGCLEVDVPRAGGGVDVPVGVWGRWGVSPQDEALPPGTAETCPRAPSRGDTPRRPRTPTPPTPPPHTPSPAGV